MQQGGFKQISQLKYGDMIKTIDLTSNTPIFSKFVMYLHNEENVLANFIQFTTNQNNIITISAKHLMAKMNTQTKRVDYVLAQELNQNDLIVSTRKGKVIHERIIKIEQVIESGIYAPLTEQGTMLVDNVLVSCYAHTHKHELAHYVFRVYFYLRNVYDMILSGLNMHDCTSNHHQTGIHWYANLVINYVPFSTKFLI
jgi:hypothetical protein